MGVPRVACGSTRTAPCRPLHTSSKGAETSSSSNGLPSVCSSMRLLLKRAEQRPGVVAIVHAEEEAVVVHKVICDVLVGIQFAELQHAFGRGRLKGDQLLLAVLSAPLQERVASLVYSLRGGAAHHIAHPRGKQRRIERRRPDFVRVQPRDAELRRERTSRSLGDRALQLEVQLGQAARAKLAEIEAIVGQPLEPVEVGVKGAESHDAVFGHVLGLIGVRFDLGLRLLLRVCCGCVVVDLREDV
eukprot:5637903-Prymnesium_polylepis.1